MLLSNSTGYCIGSVIAILLNLILPEDPEEYVKEGETERDVGKSDIEKISLEDTGGTTEDDAGGGAKAETSSDENGIITDHTEEAA